MTNHIMTLERLYEKNELEEAKRYSTELKMVLAKAAGTIKSGNPVTDVILQEKKTSSRAKAYELLFRFSLSCGNNYQCF